MNNDRQQCEDPLASSNEYDAIIIGAGVIGTAVAFELARRGWRTLSIDKGPAAGFGSTSNSGSIIRFSYSTPVGVMMAWEGMHYWTNWADYLEAPDESGLIEFVQCGMAMLVTGVGGHDEVVKPLWDKIGIPYEVWSNEDLGGRFPIFDLGIFGPPARPDNDAFWQDPTGQLAGALFCPQAGYIDDPALAAHNLMRAAEAKGATFAFNTEIVGILRDGEGNGGRCYGVRLANGTDVTARVVVNVAGPHSSIVNDMAGLGGSMNIGTRPMRHEIHQVPGPKAFDYGVHGVSIADDDNGIYFRPQSGNNLMIGGTDPDCDEAEWADPDDFNGEVTEDNWQAHVLRANKRIPSLGVPHRKMGVVGLYDVADDWIPIYDRTDLDGFYVAIGTSGNQFKNAAVAGHVMAELIEEVEDGLDHDNEPLVVRGRYTGYDLEIGSFSRNRQVNPNSSMTVHG